MMIKDEEILFLYNSNRIEDRASLGYALSLDNLNERDVHKDHLTPKQVAETAELLDLTIADLYFKGKHEAERYSDDELIQLLANDPSKMKTPIVLKKDNSFILSSSYDLIKE